MHNNQAWPAASISAVRAADHFAIHGRPLDVLAVSPLWIYDYNNPEMLQHVASMGSFGSVQALLQEESLL